MKRVILLLALVLSFSLNAQIKIGDSIPDIILKDQNNQEVKVTSKGNKFILIDFWASWCVSCRLANVKSYYL